MARSNFKERRFRCSICGAEFTALTGDQPIADTVCVNCGLRHSPEKRRKLTEERKKTKRRL